MSIRQNLEKASSDLVKVISIISSVPDEDLRCIMGEEEAWEIRNQIGSMLAYLEDEV